MSNHNLPGHRRAAPPEDNEPSWRSQDPELSDELVRSARDDGDPDAGELRDARRWESDEDHEVSDRWSGSGWSDERSDKRGAEDCAYSVTGVRDVQNRLRVRDDRAPRSNPSSDAAVCSDESSAQDSKHRA